MSKSQSLKIIYKTTHHHCKLCPNKKKMFSAIEHVDYDSGFGVQCSSVNKRYDYKNGHTSCGEIMQRVKKTKRLFGVREEMQLKDSQKNKRRLVKTINGQVDNDQGKENENIVWFSTEKKRKLDEKSRKPFMQIVVSPSVHGETANMEYTKIHGADINKTSPEIDDDELSLCAPSNDSLYDEDDQQTLENIEENVVEKTESEPEVAEVSEINTSTQEEPISHNSNSIVEKLKKIQECQECPVHLIVGGDKFVSTIKTMEAEPSLLSAMVASSITKPQLIDNIPTYSLDSNPAEFSIILDYLRKKAKGAVGYELPDRTSKNLLMETRYYELDGLNSLIVNKLKDID